MLTESDIIKDLQERISELEIELIEARNTKPPVSHEEAWGDVPLPLKNSTSKPQLQLVPPSAIIEMSKCFQLGINKGYKSANWRIDHNPPMGVYCGKVLRHVSQFLDGEDVDPESGVLHLAHAMADLAILVDAIHLNRALDDRYPKGVASELLGGK